MNELPAHWATAPLGDVTVECEQRVPSEDEEFQYVDIGAIDRDTKRITNPRTILGRDAPSRARKVIRAGDVLVSMTRPNLNAVALVPEALDGQMASTGFDVLRTLELEPRWIFYNVRAPEFVDQMSKLVRGALYPAIRSSDVRSFIAPIAPLEEQQRISDKLDVILARVDAIRENLQRVDGILTRLHEAVLAAATAGRLTAEWREAQGASREWLDVTLDMVAQDFSYGSSAKSSEIGLVPVLRMGNIKDGRLNWTDLVYTSDPSEIERYRLRAGDVLFNRTNTPELVGKTAVYHGEHDAIHAGYLIRIRCREDLVPDFLGYCLNSPAGRDYCWRVKADSVGQSNINAKKLAAFRFRLPSVDEQVEIVRRVEILLAYSDDLLKRRASAGAQLDRFVPELITQALRGELIAQVSSDEPAAIVLERIRATRAGQGRPAGRRSSRTGKAPRAPRESATMTKSRHDADVKGKPYLAELLRGAVTPQSAEDLFRRAELPVPDFFKQLDWEIKEGYIQDNPNVLELPDAS